MSAVALDEKQYIKSLESALAEKTIEAAQLRALVGQLVESQSHGDDAGEDVTTGFDGKEVSR